MGVGGAWGRAWHTHTRPHLREQWSLALARPEAACDRSTPQATLYQVRHGAQALPVHCPAQLSRAPPARRPRCALANDTSALSQAPAPNPTGDQNLCLAPPTRLECRSAVARTNAPPPLVQLLRRHCPPSCASPTRLQRRLGSYPTDQLGCASHVEGCLGQARSLLQARPRSHQTHLATARSL